MVLGPKTSEFADDAVVHLKDLQNGHQQERNGLELLDSYYAGTQPLSYMAPELVAELADRMRQVVINWPALVVDSVEERLDVEGFRLGGVAEADDDLWDVWQANGLDVGSHQAHVDALVMRRSYLIVGSRGAEDVDPSSGVDEDVPLITWESPLEVFAERNPRTRRVKHAAKWWEEHPGSGKPAVRHAALYLPTSTSWWIDDHGTWVLDEDYPVDEHDLGVVPVVPLINRPRTSNRTRAGIEGCSDLDPIIPVSDAACKMATDMMVGGEFHALPRRWATGVNREDFVDENGRPTSALSRVIGRVWANENPDVKVGQFAESDLTNFTGVIELLASIVASLSGLPPHYLGRSTDNPASADAIRSSEARLVKRAERKQRAFGEAWETVMRLAMLVRHGPDALPEGVARMETMWRDASTPTIAQSADAAVKKFQTGIVPWRQTVEDLKYSSVQISRMQEEKDAEARKAAMMFGGGPDPQMPGDQAAMTAAQAAAIGEPAATQTARVTYTTAAPAAPDNAAAPAA